MPRSSASCRPIDGRARLEQQLLDLAPDALGRQVVEWDGAADRERLRLEPRLEAGGELDRAQHAQAVVAERPRIDDAQHAVGEVVAAVERIEVGLAQRIPGDRVDREVAPPRRLLRIDSAGSPMTSKPLWPRPVFDSRRGSETSRPATL